MIEQKAFTRLLKLAERSGGALLRQILNIFNEDFQKGITELRLELNKPDRVRIPSIAHRLKSSAAEVGAETLRDVAVELENVSTQIPKPTVEKLILSLEREFHRAQEDLKRLSAPYI